MEIRNSWSEVTKKIIAYKGANLDWEAPILDNPIAIATFYSETSKIPQPNIAVACESSVYLFKNLKPYYKFNLPAQTWTKEELLVWNQFTPDSVSEFVNAISRLKEENVPLSNKAYEILASNFIEKQRELISSAKAEPLETPNVATCMDTLKKNSEDEMAISHLVIGTENKEIIILDQHGTSILKLIRIPGTPAFLDISGTLDNEYQITVLTRESRGFLIRNGELLNTIMDLESKPCGLAKVDTNIFVGSMDQTIQAFNTKNFKKGFSIKMPEPITNMETMEKGRSKSFRAYLVALLNMEIRMYNEKQLVHTFKGEDVVAGMKYGVFGREDGALVILYNRLGLEVKMLQRQFNMSTFSQASAQLQDQDQSALNMPKKTKLFIEQTQRERDQAPEMYRTYMKDLFRMKLKIAQNYVKSLKEGSAQVSGPGLGPSVRLHAQVEGIGPLFKIKLMLENLDRAPVYDLKLSYAYDSALYRLNKFAMDIPVLIPGLPYPIDVMVESVDPNGTNDTIKIFVLDINKSIPVVTAVVNMPVSEINVE